MLQSWIANIKESISATITGYLLQGLAVVPFLVALGFAIAALTIWLKSHLGDLLTYVIMAAGFALIGVIVFLFGRNVEEHHSTNETTAAAKSNGYDHAASFLDSNSAALIGLIASHLRIIWTSCP